MKIKIINPNTCLEITRSIEETARGCARPDTEMVVVSPKRGPISVEDFYDEALATVGVIEEVKIGAKEKFDGFIIACFGDPGLYASRELTESPVIGVAEASFYMACMLGYKFSILSVLDRFTAYREALLRKYGVESRCASIRCTNVPVGLDRELERELGIPVIDPVVAAVKMIEGIIECGKKTSKIRTFRPPEIKEIKGFPKTLDLK